MENRKCKGCNSIISSDLAFCPFCSTKQFDVKKKIENTSVIDVEDFNNTMPIKVNKNKKAVFEEKPEKKLQKTEIEKTQLEKEKQELKNKHEEIKQEKDELKKENDHYKYLALHDELTGLKNRASFDKDIKEISIKELGIISVDANNLKKINDNMGHKYGDLLITTVATTLKEIFGENTYRVGGDEFSVILNGEREGVINKKIEKFHEILKQKQNEMEEDFEISASLGVAYYNGTNSVKDIIEEADQDMYIHKKKYKENTVFDNNGVYEPNYDGYYDDVKAEYEKTVVMYKNENIKKAIGVGVLTIVLLGAYFLIVF